MWRIFRIILIIFLLERVILVANAALEIVSVLPNTVDDKNLEYFELRNTGCSTLDLSGYTLQDALPNPYRVQWSRMIDAHTTLRFARPETKIELNNTNERIDILDPARNIVATFSYATSTKWVVITRSVTDEICPLPTSSTGWTESPIWGTNTDPENTTNSGTITGSGYVETATGTNTSPDTSSGSTSTGEVLMNSGSTTDTSSSGSVASSSWTLEGSSGSTISSTENTSSGSAYSSTGGGSGTNNETNTDQTSSWSTQSWTSISISYTETGILSPQSLVYDDRDTDGKIDTLEIEYPYVLTGVVNTGMILLYSRTGGLSTEKIDTLSGRILEGYLSGTTLILSIVEWDLEKSELYINNTTTSDLRLKSSGDLGFRSLGGQVPVDFLLTRSFDEYKNVSRKTSSLTSSQSGSTIASTGSSMEWTWSTAVILWNQSIYFPVLQIELQSPSNVTQSGNILTCENWAPCRVNLTLESIFSSAFPMRDYVCEISFSGTMLEDCNPNTLYFDSDDRVKIALKHKVLTGSIEQEYLIVFPHKLDQDSLSGIVNIPDIVPTIQSPSNSTFSGSSIICSDASICRVNLTLEPLFASGFTQSDFECLISTGWLSILDCNPNTLYWNTSGTLDITLRHKSGIEKSAHWEVVMPITITTGTPGIPHTPNTLLNTPPVAILEHDGKWKKYYEQREDYHLLCYAFTCSINFTAERSYDPDGGRVTFLWVYDYTSVKTSRDPGSYTMGMWPHWINLRVFDEQNAMTEIRYKVEVLGEKEEKSIEKPKKSVTHWKTVASKTKTVTEVQKWSKKKKKSKPMLLFNPPNILLQKMKEWLSYSGNVYHCRTKEKTCSVNFVLDETYKWYTYEWVFPERKKWENVFVTKNPRSYPFPVGTSIVLLTVRDAAGNAVNELRSYVYVEKIQKTKKTSSRKPKSASWTKKNENSVKLAIKSNWKEKDNTESIPIEYAALLFLSSGLISSRYLRRKLNT